MRVYIGAGFGLQHVDSSLGGSYVRTQLLAGVRYKITRQAYITASTALNYGKTRKNGSYQSFDGNTFSLGVGILFPKMRKRQPLPPGLMKPKGNIPQRKGARKVRRPSAYEQTQKLMSELSWPTY